MRYPYISIRMVNPRITTKINLIMPSAGEVVEQPELVYSVDWNVK
jgi:hypothetical protein